MAVSVSTRPRQQPEFRYASITTSTWKHYGPAPKAHSRSLKSKIRSATRTCHLLRGQFVVLLRQELIKHGIVLVQEQLPSHACDDARRRVADVAVGRCPVTTLAASSAR
jgi:hypothetical protein